MTTIPEVVPISEMRIRQAEILEGLGDRPVVLAHRGHAAAVLVSLEKWNGLIEELEDLRDAVELMEARQSRASFTDLDEYLARRSDGRVSS
ncbi:MAG: type II toxin-antitoxin system Phd/YefM family antitoxin [Anaerolineae bacterium]